MRMALHTFEKRMSRFLGLLVQKRLLNAGPVLIRYVDKPTPATGFDPNVEASYPVLDQKQVTVNALIHIVSARATQRQFAEIKTGDLILTFESVPRDVDNPDDNTNMVDLTKMDQVRFVVNGALYVQQAVGKDLAQYWDAVLGGYPLSQTLLLRLSD